MDDVEAEPAEPGPASLAQQKLESQRVVTVACMEQLVEQLEMTRQRGSLALGEAIGDLRRHAKAVGEKVSLLRPSWRGTSSRGSAPAVSGPTAVGASKTSKVEGLIRTLATAQGRQQARDAEAAQEAATQKVAMDEIPVLVVPPMKTVRENEWRICGVYEHQVLKAGLRQLEDQWPADGLQDFPRSKDGGSALFRERLLGDLLVGKIRLQSVPTSDVSAAQRDVHRLSLRQLLRLRVLHLDFTPSGCGADTVTAVGGTHEAFLTTLDSLLFQHLGRTATAALEKCPGGKPPVADEHRLGREAVLLVAAAAAVSATPWWCWWLTNERRTFFHGSRFLCNGSFPEGEVGVLEVNDLSKPDRNDPTGRMRWLDWQVVLVDGEKKLAEAPRRDTADRGTDGAIGGNLPSKGADLGSAGVAASNAAGAATATMVSPEVLRGLRGALRKTGGPGSPGKADH